jgi:hypothetical protein
LTVEELGQIKPPAHPLSALSPFSGSQSPVFFPPSIDAAFPTASHSTTLAPPSATATPASADFALLAATSQPIGIPGASPSLQAIVAYDPDVDDSDSDDFGDGIALNGEVSAAFVTSSVHDVRPPRKRRTTDDDNDNTPFQKRRMT